MFEFLDDLNSEMLFEFLLEAGIFEGGEKFVFGFSLFDHFVVEIRIECLVILRLNKFPINKFSKFNKLYFNSSIK